MAKSFPWYQPLEAFLSERLACTRAADMWQQQHHLWSQCVSLKGDKSLEDPSLLELVKLVKEQLSREPEGLEEPLKLISLSAF